MVCVNENVTRTTGPLPTSVYDTLLDDSIRAHFYHWINARVNVNSVEAPWADPRNSDGEQVCLSESPSRH